MKKALLLIIIYHQNPPRQLETEKLYENVNKQADVVREYDLTPSTLDQWIKNHQNTGSLKSVDNRFEEEI
ncbi:hypothetical protein [Solibacillus sp. FSL K6-1554]|uniref:hypothetical protein n=1 Tax=Solibacillus sp. FSL K6-1554 TaxID=2921472 RepID=UPI0030F83D74